ncbi:ras guanine nucleotide exchange factor domain-containing protein [Lentinula raphanica]|nr:ras guanine nucleotide exchange factor domain-containing protein [Lentinula raphanica]
MSASSQPVPNVTRRDNPKAKEKTTAGPVAPSLPTPPSSRRRRSASIDSDDTGKAIFISPPADAASSSSSRSKYNLHAGHPSIFRSIKLLRALRGSTDVSGARAVAQVLLSNITNVVHLMQVPEDVKDDNKYLENVQGVSFMRQQLMKEVQRLEQVKESQELVAVARLIDISELTIAALERLLGLAERMVKPLPGIPTDTTDSEAEENSPESDSVSHLRPSRESVLSDRSFVRISLAQIAAEALDSSPVEDSSESSSSGSGSRTSAILTILHKAREKSVLGSLFRSKSESEDSAPSGRDESSESENELPQYAPRHSALYYPVDPLHPNDDVELPMSEDAMDITLSHDNKQMIKMSLTAVIRLLTSKDAIRDPYFLHWFFTAFRYALLPSEVLDLFISRFNESMPDHSMDRKQIRVWCNNHEKIVRPRVVSVLIRWLTQFWEPPYDNVCVLNDMQDFVLKQVSASLLPDRLGIAFAQAVKAIRVDGVTRTTWLQDRWHKNMVFNSLSTSSSESYSFVTECETKFPLEAFDCPTGHKVFAEQLTRLAVDVWTRLPAQALIRMWLGRKMKACEARLEAKLGGMKERKEALEMELKTLFQQINETASQIVVGTLKARRKKLLKESNQLAGQISTYEASLKDIYSSTKLAEGAATAVRHFDRSLFMFVINTVLLETENEDDMVRAINFWFRVCTLCFEMKNNSCAFTIFIGIANMTYVWRLVEILPALDPLTHELHEKFCTIFEINEQKLNADELQNAQLGTVACVPRFHNVEKNITHIAHASTVLIAEDNVHANHLRVIGKVVSAIEAPRLYVLPEDIAVKSLLQSHISRFQVADEATHMKAFECRTNQLKPRPQRTPAATTSPLLSPPQSPRRF